MSPLKLCQVLSGIVEKPGMEPCVSSSVLPFNQLYISDVVSPISPLILLGSIFASGGRTAAKTPADTAETAVSPAREPRSQHVPFSSWRVRLDDAPAAAPAQKPPQYSAASPPAAPPTPAAT